VDKVLRYFSFRGRANRQRYWLTALALYGLMVVALLLAFIVPVVGGVVGVTAVVAFLVAVLALAARRLHDRGKSAWWLLIMYVPLVVLSGLGQVASISSPEAGAGFALLSLPFSVWILVELGCLRGTVGPNRFGPDPLQPAPVEVFS
jgi:uncharacterized membrane protein YhaH (DUF805 family)